MYQTAFMLSFIALLVLAPVAGMTAAAQEASPETPELPAATAPFDLGTVTLPGNVAGITAVFARLPDEVAGQPRAVIRDGDSDRLAAAYGADDASFGPPLVLQAMDFTTGDFFPKTFTAMDFVSSAASTADYDAVAYGREGTLVWVRAETTVGVAGDKPGTPEVSRVIHTLAWGDATSSWLFTAAGFTPEGLDALVSAFVAAGQAQPATPVTDWRTSTAIVPVESRMSGCRSAELVIASSWS